MIGNKYKFRVHGKGPFPMRLLAYYKCFPATADDACLLSGSLSESTRAIEMESITKPSPKIWNSYGWSIVRLSGPGLEPDKNEYEIYHTWPC